MLALRPWPAAFTQHSRARERDLRADPLGAHPYATALYQSIGIDLAGRSNSCGYRQLITCRARRSFSCMSRGGGVLRPLRLVLEPDPDRRAAAPAPAGGGGGCARAGPCLAARG